MSDQRTRDRNREACRRYRARKAQPVASIPDLPGEEWRPYPGAPESYDVSNLGRVRSRDRTVSGRIGRFDNPDATVEWRFRGRLRAQYTDRANYLCVGLCGTGKPSSTHHVHTLVCETFHGPRPPGMLALHRNDIRHDNRAENLRWGTPLENAADAGRNGRLRRALPVEHDREIVARIAAGESYRSLSRTFGVSPSTISRSERAFWAAHGVDPNALATELRAAYDAENIAESGEKCY